MSESRFIKGIDLVVVARIKSATADYARIERDFLGACASLGLLKKDAAE